ncbi:glycoside hydrolase [Novosphingobium guangzhouense]|uniref:Glycoside hydrolase n=1 Tax=Novosphingobium guangzhouense TaxID=1850347 RepID=A0A2K2G177_9SPHN|nr:glycoside hydrolase [Novosphingobium guangzhouense]PNU04777.1 glycoside hydrolase [Novosphingobium guangzhouense]
MSFTFVGLLQLAIGFMLLFRSLPAMLVFVMASGLFGGSAALSVPALGNSSIPPIQFALIFLYLRILMPSGGQFGLLTQGIRDSFALVLFTLYGLAAAFIAPRLFAGHIEVAPMRFDNARNLFDTVPLRPTAQNITAAVYMLGALLATLGTYAAVRVTGGIEALVKGSVAIAWVHALSGVIASQTKGTPVEGFFALFRNGSYAQLDQSYQGFSRVDGFFPEASGWASFALAWFVFNCECWYRSVWARHTGAAALAVGAVLFFSTSSTAYVGLGSYGAFFAIRALAFPASAEPVRLRQAGITVFAIVVIAAIGLALVPGGVARIGDMVLHMTVEKGNSDSGQQRLFWAMQGLTAFTASGGLGVGPGSFRSSSLFMAILGTMGVVGIVTFGIYLFNVVSVIWRSPAGPQGMEGSAGPARERPRDAVRAVMEACAVTAPLILVPAAISSPNSHPGVNFAIFAGAAMALYRMLPRPLIRPDLSLVVSRRISDAPAGASAGGAAGASAAGWPT